MRLLDRTVAACATVLLVWACCDYGAFLEPAKTVMAVALPALGLLWVVSSAARRRAAPWRPPGATDGPAGRARIDLAGVLLGGLAVFGALSAAWSLDWADSLRASGILVGGCVYLHIGRRVGAASPRGRLMLLWPLGATGAVIALLSVIGYASRWWRFSLEKDGVLTATGTLGYANALAGLLLLTLAATITIALETPSPLAKTAARVTLVPAVGIQVAALVLTRSKGAAAVAFVLLMLWLIARAFAASDRGRRRRWMGVILALVLAAALAAGGYALWKDIAPQMAVSGLPPSDAGPDTVVPMTSNAFRIKTWRAALEAAAERPVAGWGLDTFYEAYAPFKLGGHTAYAHNVVVQHLVEVGAIGTVLLLAFLLAAALLPVRTLLGPIRDPRIPLALGVQTFVLHNLIDLTWYFPALFFIFTLLLGLAASSASPSAGSPIPKGGQPLDRTSSSGVLCCRRPFD